MATITPRHVAEQQGAGRHITMFGVKYRALDAAVAATGKFMREQAA